MRFRPVALLYFLIFSLPLTSFSQVGCEYTLKLFDSFGDGWNGGFLTITTNDKSEDYPFPDGAVREYSLFALEGDSLSVSFIPGSFAFEASFSIFNSEGVEIFYSGQDPPFGEVYRTIIMCPSCPNLITAGVQINDIRHDRAHISWVPNDSEGSYVLRVGSVGTPLTDIPEIQIQKMSEYRINGLEEQNEYAVYLQAICSNGDTSSLIGPFSFETLPAKDVGIFELTSPVSDCDLPADAVIEVVLKNYGGAPQSLIPFNYSVNGIPGAVNQPNDGFFTGILSHDSTYRIRFDATYDFSEPQPYELKVWTELEGDNNFVNDTLYTTIIHTPLVDQFPYEMEFETGAGGWTLDLQESVNASLELGAPDGSVIQAANSGTQAWVTNLNGSYNNNERSILLSPCFDFSVLEKDPELSFYLWIATESTFDGLWVETSVDGGAWTKLGAVGETGVFWYNTIDDIYEDWWSGNNLFGGWRQVRHPLVGLAGKSDVRIRFVFRSDEAVTREGVGIDDIFIAPILENNLGALEITNQDNLGCGSDSSQVTLSFRNEGTAPQMDFSLAYQVNNGPVVKETFAEQIAPGTTIEYTFQATFDASMPQEYQIRAWTETPGEEFPANDTVTWLYSTAGPGLPFLENFETGDIPENWITDPDLVVDQGHSSGSGVLYDNLWQDDTIFQAISPVLGPIAAEDSLFFSYRFVDFTGFGTAPTVLGNGDALYVEISEDCGVSFNEVLVINADNHQTKNTFTRVGIPLSDYEGQWIKVRFRAIWGSGDYYFDLDDVNIRRCPLNLGIQATVTHPVEDNANGSIRLNAEDGIGPYSYAWSNGHATASQSGLEAGTYQITVADQQGCQDLVTVILEALVPVVEPESPFEIVKLAPNPNEGHSLLSITLKKPEDISIFVFDTRGSLIRDFTYRQVPRIRRELDLSHYPNGIYFIRVLAGKEVKTLRLIKANAP